MSTQAEQRVYLAAEVDHLAADVDGTTVTTSAHPTKPPTPAAYDMWPVWVASRPVGMCVNEWDWQVLLALPGSDPQTWCATGDALVDVIQNALSDHDITRIEPVQILLAESQAMPGIAVTLTF